MSVDAFEEPTRLTYDEMCGEHVTAFFRTSSTQLAGISGSMLSACTLEATMPFIYDTSITCQVCGVTCSNPVAKVIPSHSVVDAANAIKELAAPGAITSITFKGDEHASYA